MNPKKIESQGTLNFNEEILGEIDEEVFGEKLKTSNELEFLEESNNSRNGMESIFDLSSWSLQENGNKLKPLEFSNGKTQEDVVKEVCMHIKNGVKVVFIHGACGTGKSAIALNIAREIGKASIVVPVKGLQRQYEEDYMHKKQVFKKNGKKMKIAMITGRENHDSLLIPGKSCADQTLPDTVKLTEKNLEFLEKYYEENPLLSKKDFPGLKNIKRISVAPANPYWSPIVNAAYELPLKDAKKIRYDGVDGREYIFYHRKKGCSYFDQYLAYVQADVIIFNAAKYKIEMALGRKPATEVDIIDEADEFLDNFSSQEELNLTRLHSALQHLSVENLNSQKNRDKLMELIELEEKNKRALGVDSSKIFELKNTHLYEFFRLLLSDLELQSEISIDELTYASTALEIAEAFKELFANTYVVFSKREENLYASFVTTQLSHRFKEIIDRNKTLVLMSGTLHSKEVLRDIFGIENFAFVEAETGFQGQLDICRTGKEFVCKYDSFSKGKHTREEYLKALEACLEKAEKPVLVHVTAFEDLPSEIESDVYGLSKITSREMLFKLQNEDKTGRLISLFKKGLSDTLFSTKCSRGVDFPGDQCKSIIFTKYPNPNVQGVFWKVFAQTHKRYYWEFYRDKAKREFLQRLYRGLRSKEDHVFILSPDSRVLDAVRELQRT